MKSWTTRGTWAALLCCVGMAYADRPDNPAEPVDWDVLPNGLIGVQYDPTGSGVPDHVALHQIAWSGWTAQPISEIEAQARQDNQWVFIVDYDQDQYVCMTGGEPLFAGEVQQNGRWTARLASTPCSVCAP